MTKCDQNNYLQAKSGNMYSYVLYSQTTDKGNEPDGRRVEYTDKGKVFKSPEKNKFFSSFDADIERGISLGV